MSDSITLHEILSQYRKSDLVEIAKLHHLHGYSQYKKAQMVEFLCRATSSMQFSHYAQVSSSIAKQVLTEVQGRADLIK